MSVYTPADVRNATRYLQNLSTIEVLINLYARDGRHDDLTEIGQKITTNRALIKALPADLAEELLNNLDGSGVDAAAAALARHTTK